MGTNLLKNKVAAAATTKASDDQKIRFDQQTIKQKLKEQNEKLMMAGGHFSNLNIF